MESNTPKEYEIEYSKTKYKKMVEAISKAEDRNALILFIGAGVSISQGYPNWNEYIDKLIKYWTFHLNDLIDKEITKEKEVMRQDVLLLDQLLESNMDKKRKVDLVHHMIKKYTKIDGDEDASKTRYEENLLKFERYYFNELPVCSANNEILRHLVNLNATYLTTNYDSEIEKHVKNKIDVLNDLSEVSSDIKKNSVIHLHGTPKCNPNFFISSASSYVNLYYPNKNEERYPLQNIKEIIQQKSDATIVFIGCSMEEDEVLSILKLAEDEKEDKEKEIKYYALLKYDNSINLQIRDHYHKTFNDYMQSTKNVDIIWYGDEFDDLPKFCEMLVNDVTLKREENMSSAEFDWRILNGEQVYWNSKIDNSYIETINKYIKNENYAFLDKVFKNYDNLPTEKVLPLLKYALKSDLVKKQKASYTANYTFFWQQISCYYEQFDSDEKEVILLLIKNLKAYNKSTADSLYHIVIKAFTTIEAKREYLSFLIKIDHLYEFVKDNDLRCLWFIEQMKSKANIYINFDDFKTLEFNFNEQLWKELILYLTKIDESTIYDSFTYILENKGVNLISYCLKEEKLLYQGKREFPNEFYHLKIIQRVFINIDLQQDLNEETLEKVILNIDTSFRFYGKEMNEFVKKHQELFPKTFSPDYFINGFEVGQFELIHQYPYLSINILLNQPIENSIEILLNSKDFIPLGDFKERSIEGQIRELSRLFTEEYSVDKKEKITTLLKALIENNILYWRYCESIVEFFIVSKDRTMDNINLLLNFIEKTKISNEFNFHLSKLYRFLFKNGFIEVEQVKERFFDYRVDNFSINNVFLDKEEKSYIDINVYINTEVGRYFETIRTLDDEILDKEDIQYLVIKQLQDTPEIYKSYITGQFPYLWKKNLELVPTIESYQGFSHKYRIGTEELEWFKPIIKEILETDNFDDERTLFNSMIILFETTSPEGISIHNHDYFNKLALKMLDGYLENDYEFRYSEEWINYLLSNEKYSESLVKNLFPRLSKMKTDKIGRLLLFLEKMPLHNWKLKTCSYSYALCKQFKKEQLEYISKLMMLLLKKDIVNVDYECIECIDSILEQMVEFKMITNINQLLNEVKNYLTTEDYTKLNDKFRYF